MSDEKPSTPTRSGREETGFYEAYAGFARTLRAWFVAYGIGGPVLFVTNDTLSKKLTASGVTGTIAMLFLAGVGLQVLSALMYKGAMWYLYLGELNPEVRKLRRHGLSDWLSEAFWVELLLDVGTIVLFSIATWTVIRAVRG